MQSEDWNPATAYNPVTHKEYRPKSQANSENFLIKDQSNEAYQQLWQQFKVAESIIRSYDKSDMISGKQITVLRYGMGDSIIMHDDLGIQKDRHGIKGSFEAAYTCLLYLNEVKGGELVLPSIKQEISPKAGTMVIFHASEKHGVNQVLSPQRYAVLFRLSILR